MSEGFIVHIYIYIYTHNFLEKTVQNLHEIITGCNLTCIGFQNIVMDSNTF